MNKKLLLVGFAAAAFLTLTAFAAKTLAEQRAEIDAAVQAKLTELRTMKQQECDERVATEANRRFDEAMAVMAAEDAKAIAAGKKPKKRGTSTTRGNTVDPIPGGTTPTDPTQAKKDKTSGNAPVNTEDKKSKTAGEAPASNTEKKKSKTAGNPPSGGGN